MARPALSGRGILAFSRERRGRATGMGWFDAVHKGISIANRYIAGVGACFLIPLMIMTAADVVGRDALNRPIPGTIELSQYMLSVFILLGFAYTQQVKGHVTVSLFTSRLPYRAQLILKIITTLLILLVSCVIAWQGWVIGIEEKTVSDMLRVPQYPFRLLVALAAFMLCLQSLTDLGESLKKLAGRVS
jgi:TRAP-type C4-dicarboxylate transport system permease small subunit